MTHYSVMIGSCNQKMRLANLSTGTLIHSQEIQILLSSDSGSENARNLSGLIALIPTKRAAFSY